ncbi:MAG: hypothetical protein IKA12_02145 [Clostridia bacterium]|nr:hypothetical protein [Clostridia bacterium]
MIDILKIFHELITQYREPDCMFSFVENEKKEFISQLKKFKLQLDKNQQQDFKDLTKQAVKVLFHELKKYYFLGFDEANKKSDV